MNGVTCFVITFFVLTNISGDPVSLLVEKSPTSLPTKYIAKQVLVSENTATILGKALESPASANSNGILNEPEDEGISS